MSEFTKGPWVSYPPHSEKDFLNSAIVNIESEDGCHVCSTTIYKRTFKEIKANANLISAAPDMYEVLEDIYKNHEAGFYIDTMISKVLAKARGEL